MENSYYEKLKKEKFLRGGKVQPQVIDNLPYSKLLDIFDELYEISAKADISTTSSLHTHCATLGLSGDTDECNGLSCRSAEVDKLSQFAALYSEKVFIHNCLDKYAPVGGHTPRNSSVFRENLVKDLTIIAKLQPMIETSRIAFFSPRAHLCPKCYADKIFGSQAGLRLDKAMKTLAKDLLKRSKVEIESKGGNLIGYISPENDLFRHSLISWVMKKSSPFVKEHPEYIKSLNPGQRIEVSGKIKSNLGLHKQLAQEVLVSLSYQMSVTDLLDAYFLTDRGIDANVLAFISNDDEISKRNLIALNHLSTIVPFVGDVPIEKLVSLRKREEGSFIQFRAALDSAIQQIASSKNDFSERDAKALYSDVISPELSKLDLKVKEAKPYLVTVPIIAVAGTIASLSFGIYAGMVPDEIKNVATALGLTGTISNTVSKTIQSLDIEKSVRPEKFYFLWKVRHLAENG